MTMARLPIVTGLALLALIHVTMSISVQEFFPEIKNNLTMIKWSHATNNKAKLDAALESSEVMMIEADVVFGYQILSNGSTSTVPTAVMAHPPDNTSNLILSDFLQTVKNHNKANKTKKGVKLDFKSKDAFSNSVSIIAGTDSFNAPLWVNADILKGPVDATNDPMPVDPVDFLTKANQNFAAIKPVLSIGWTTRYVPPVGNATTTGNYTTQQVKEMLKLVNETANTNLPITYPVRACYAANSMETMKSLLADTPAKNNATLTVWSADDDKVDTDKLSELIKAIGVEKVYIDVPKSILDKLDVSSAFIANSSVFVVFASMIVALVTAKLV
ncbi:protein FAM151B [Phymastichus coffea]|uniref:protein FAM151B n=1 Tax=Phymastichus coffea TaxID=108790 RepID=UPI00273C6A3D|nr:protein FAM151B [Phymastichus coffea]